MRNSLRKIFKKSRWVVPSHRAVIIKRNLKFGNGIHSKIFSGERKRMKTKLTHFTAVLKTQILHIRFRMCFWSVTISCTKLRTYIIGCNSLAHSSEPFKKKYLDKLFGVLASYAINLGLGRYNRWLSQQKYKNWNVVAFDG